MDPANVLFGGIINFDFLVFDGTGMLQHSDLSSRQAGRRRIADDVLLRFLLGLNYVVLVLQNQLNSDSMLGPDHVQTFGIWRRCGERVAEYW